MKIPKSATQAAAPLSSPGSSAIGFEAPFQYAVTSADAAQMYRFPSIIDSSRILDTENPHNIAEIKREIMQRDIAGVMDIWQGIALEAESKTAAYWIPILQQRLHEFDQDPSLSHPDPKHLGPVLAHAKDNQGVSSQGEVFFSYGIRRVTETASNADIDQMQSPFYKPKANNREHHVSRNDSEVQTLEELYQLVIQNMTADQTGDVPAHPLTVSNAMEIGLYINMGPCDGCKDRIDLFWRMVQQFVTGLGLKHDVKISLDIFYQTARFGKNRHGQATDYGYPRKDRRLSHVQVEMEDDEQKLDGFKYRLQETIQGSNGSASSSSASGSSGSSSSGDA